MIAPAIADELGLGERPGRSVLDNCEYNTGTTLPAVTYLMSRVGFRDTGFYVDVPSQQTTPGLAMQLFGCNNTLALLWVVGF